MIKFDFSKYSFPLKVKICRNLEDLSYSFTDEKLKAFDPIAKEIIRKTPYILYNDDFIDRPPNYVDIPVEKPSNLSDWLAIYNRVFEATNSDYSLFKIDEEIDDRRQDSILSDVEEELNKRLIKAWKTFLLGQYGGIKVKLKLTDSPESNCNKRLEISIVEKIRNKERFFEIIDRSKGFLWFYNFVMKLEFNPKIMGKKKDTIYLLDEPGSYLHSTAQEKLCQKLKEISEKDGNVIYCTHSHHLINPDFIPLNRVYIVEKCKNKNITATPLPKMKPKTENKNAYQPIIDALQIPAFNLFNDNDSIIAVEGIYDKYVIQSFINLGPEFKILPGASANSIVKNIQYLIGFSKKFIAIWDNDSEGKKEFENSKKIFGEIESSRFDLLPLRNKRKRRMEDMFEHDDLEIIADTLDLETNADYEKIISTLFFAKRTMKQTIIRKLSTETIENFRILESIIKKRFIKADEIHSLMDSN